MTNEEHAAYFNRSKKENSRVDGSLEQVQMLRNTKNRATKPSGTEGEILIH